MWYNVKMWKYAICVIVAFIVVYALTGCASTKRISKTVYVTDTTKLSTSDTILNRRFIEAFEALVKQQEKSVEKRVMETTHINDSTAPKFDKNGNHIGDDHYRTVVRTIESSEVTNLKEKIEHLQGYKDSTVYLRHQVDSLTKLKDKGTPYYIEKKLNVVQKTLMWLGVVFLLVILFYLYAVIKNIVSKFKCKKE